MMKKLFPVLLLLIGSSIQVLSQESSVYLKGGLNLANVSINGNGDVDQANTLPSFQVGLQGDLPVTSFLSIQPGLFFTGKGVKAQSGQPGQNGYFRAVTNPFYMELPVNIVFKAPLNKTSRFFAGAGPYVAMGIAGKRKLDYQVIGIAYSRTDKINFSNDDPTTSGEEGAGYGILKRFDYGLNGTVGFEGNNTVFSVNYGLGLAKLQSGTNSNGDNNDKHRVFSVTVGFKL
ncbi:MAG: outer membrane beta-barrel protein [Terrimonas sp.]|nr:outer membrane beta-barrel protein [Terrimonas sp.]